MTTTTALPRLRRHAGHDVACDEPGRPNEPLPLRPGAHSSATTQSLTQRQPHSAPSSTGAAPSPWPRPLDRRLTRPVTLRVLTALAALGREPVHSTDLVYATQMSRPDISKTVHLLADHGLAAIEPDPDCSRRRLYSLTDRGYACATADPPPQPAPPATRTPPHHGPCPPGPDCDSRLRRSSTRHILIAIQSATAPQFTPHKLAPASNVSHEQASSGLAAMALDGLVARVYGPSGRQTRHYQLTPLGHWWLHGHGHNIPTELRPGDRYLTAEHIDDIVTAIRQWPTECATTTTIQRLTHRARSTITATLQLLNHRGLITDDPPSRSRLRRVRLTVEGHAWLTKHHPPTHDKHLTRAIDAPQRDRVVAAITSDLSASPPLWSAQMPSTRVLVRRYHASDLIVRDAQRILEQRGVLQRVPLSTRASVYRVVRPISASDRSCRRSRAVPETHAACATTPHGDRPPAAQTETAISDGISDRPERSPRPNARHDVAGPQRTIASKSALSHRHCGEESLPILYRELRALIAFGDQHIPITVDEATVRCDADANAIIDGMTIFEALGAVTVDRSAADTPHWSRNPSWTVHTNSLAVRDMVAELARRIETGWYQWTGMNGATYRRPFPTLSELAHQFSRSEYAACQSVAELHRLTYIRTATATPPNLDNAVGHQLLQRCADASLVVDTQQLTSALGAMPRSWFPHRELGVPGQAQPASTRT